MTDEEMIHGVAAGQQVARLRAVMHRLRAPGGCPWDAEQTHESIISNLIEEAYECVDAIRSGDDIHLREELGDLLLQVVFHSEIAEGEGRFDLDEVARDISEKLIRRHPHVFGDVSAENSDEVLKRWDEIKRREKGEREVAHLHGVGKGLPALVRAGKLLKKAAKIGFDWPQESDVVAKIREELGELEAALESEGPVAVEEELGDLLLAVVNLARYRNIDPEVLMAAANKKFERRFAAMELELQRTGAPLGQAGLTDMQAAWHQIKTRS